MKRTESTYRARPFAPLPLAYEAAVKYFGTLEGELGDRNDEAARVLNEDCPSDEAHCTCVPHLRARIAELERSRADLVDAFGMGDQRDLCNAVRQAGAKNEIYKRRIAELEKKIELKNAALDVCAKAMRLAAKEMEALDA
jgi:hypothetical protein